MKREEALKFLFDECSKLPDRQMCCEATEEEIKNISTTKLNLEKMLDFLQEYDFELEFEEISPIRHQIILYFICIREYTDYEIQDWEIWNHKNKETKSFVKDAIELLDLGPYDDLCETSIADFLEYSRSDKQDF